MYMNIRQALAAAAVAGLLAFAGQADAAVYTATITGTIAYPRETGDTVGLFNSASTGTAFTAVYRWDEDDDQVSDPDEYSGLMTATLTIGSSSFAFEDHAGSIYFSFGRYFVSDSDLVDAGRTWTITTRSLVLASFGGDGFGQADFANTTFTDLGYVGGVQSTRTGSAEVQLAPTALVTAREGEGGPVSGVPEPAAWALMILGFGAAGGMLRNSRRRGAPA
jgi:hypothetical protein